MGVFKRFMLGTAFAAAVGGGIYTRHAPGMQTEQVVKVLDVKDHASAQEQAEGEHDYRVITDKGVFRNANDWLALKFGSSSEDLQSYFKKGRSYKVTSFEPYITSRIGDPNIISVVPVDPKGEIKINIEENKKPPAGEIKPPAVKKNPPPASEADGDHITTNPDVVLFPQTRKPPASAEGKRTLDQGRGPGYAAIPNEAEFVKAFFGSNLTTDDLRMHFYEGAPVSEHGGVTAADVENTTDGRSPVSQVMNLYSYQDAYTSQDYTQEVHEKFCVWMHEWTHVWQGQGLDRYTLGVYGGYDYVLSPQKKFIDYGPEQQASIVMDYCGRFLHLDARWRNPVGGGLEKETADALLKDVIETQFPGAKILRLKMEEYRANNRNSQILTKNMPQAVADVPTL